MAVVAVDNRAQESFTTFFQSVEPRLRYALIAALGHERGREATSEAMAYAWEQWDRIEPMENPAGYLYRVGRSRGRVRWRRPRFDPQSAPGFPDMEPGLPEALKGLSENQRITVFLVHAMGWTRRETADLLGISVNSVGSHLDRGLNKLRTAMGVRIDD